MTKNPENIKANLLFDWLQKPYYLNDKTSFKITFCFVMGIVSFLFIYLYEPSGIKKGLLVYSIISGAIVFISLFVYFFIVRWIFKSYFNPEKWNIGKHIFTVFSLMLSGAFMYWLLKFFIIDDSVRNIISFHNILYYTFTIGLFPVIIYLFIDEWYGKMQAKKETSSNKNLKNSIEIKKNKSVRNFIDILSYNKKEVLKVKIKNLVYVTSEANYASFYLIENGVLKHKIIRKPLKLIEKDFEGIENIIRCHKSYIINTHFLKNSRGNSRGYFLNLKYCDLEIPVSRNIGKEKLNAIGIETE